MKIYAVYRMYYGEDFIEASICSIYDRMDKIFVFLPGASYGNVCMERVDRSADIVKEMAKTMKKITLINNIRYYMDPMNQFTRLYNSYISKYNDRPDAVMLIEPDMVWNDNMLDIYLDKLASTNHADALMADQIEFWHNHNWVIPYRYRKTLITHYLGSSDNLKRTDRSGHLPKGFRVVDSTATVNNYGFCVSPRNMKIKCDLAIKFSEYIGDSIPNPNWYENKWLAWDPVKNNKNLEISKGYEHLIPYAQKGNIILPESLKDHKWNPDIFTPVQD